MKAIPLILKGNRTPRYTIYGGIDAFNALEQEKKKTLTLLQVKEQFQITHKQLLSFLSEIPDADFITNHRLLNRLKWDTFHHYDEHAHQIMTWRERQGI